MTREETLDEEFELFIDNDRIETLWFGDVGELPKLKRGENRSLVKQYRPAN